MAYTNLDGTTPDKRLGDVLRWTLQRKWFAPPYATPRQENDGTALRRPEPHLTWIGHASFLLRLGGRLAAIDPVWSRYVGGTPRNVAPGVALEAVPDVDLVAISHSHFDHLDLSTVRRLARRAQVVVPSGLAARLRSAGVERVVELGWMQSHDIGPLKVTLVPAHHWSMRTPWDRNRTLWGGYVFESGEGVAYHAGDTAHSPLVFEAIRERFPRIDWAMLPIGAYDPPWFMQPQHLNPEEAGAACHALGARLMVAMHWGTFRLSDEPMGEPPERLRRWWQQRGHDSARLWIPAVGETRALRG